MCQKPCLGSHSLLSTPVVESLEAAPCYDVVTPLDLRHKRAQR